MKQWKQMTGIVLLLTVFLCCPIGAAEKGAKSLFYDSNAAGTVQIAEPGAGGGGSGSFTPSVSRVGPDGNPVNPVSNYYENLNPGVMYWIELIRPGSGNIKRVSNDRVFRSGDRIRLHITANSDGYLHVLHSGSSGASQIMPVSGTRDGSVQMGADYVVPSNGGWLQFDNNPGKERLKLVFASVKSPDDIVSAMRSVSVQNASTASGQLMAIYNQYRNSPNYLTQVQRGSKDFKVVMRAEYDEPAAAPSYNSSAAQPEYYDEPVRSRMPEPSSYLPPPIRFNTQADQNFRVDRAAYEAPGNYVVSRSAPGAVKEPVVIEISLNHHP